MIDWIIDLFKARIFQEIIYFLFYGGGIFAVLKLHVWLNSKRLYSFIRIYFRKDEFINHRIFSLIEKIIYRDNVAHSVLDPAKKKIVEDLFSIELIKIKQALRNILKHIFKSNLRRFLTTYSDFETEKIIDLFLSEYTETRILVEQVARARFTHNGMTHEDFNRLWMLYAEISHDYELIIYESLRNYENEGNIINLLHYVLQDFIVLIQIINKTIGGKFNRLNGRSYGITYKGRVVGEYYAT